MTTPDSVAPVISNTAGTVSRSTASEWYRVAVNGDGRFVNTPFPL